jgi:hypothetical protein
VAQLPLADYLDSLHILLIHFFLIYSHFSRHLYHRIYYEYQIDHLIFLSIELVVMKAHINLNEKSLQQLIQAHTETFEYPLHSVYHLLFISVIFCNFISQPTVICANYHMLLQENIILILIQLYHDAGISSLD